MHDQLRWDTGVATSDVFVMLGSPGYLTRPWCLLEIHEARKLDVPVVLLQCPGFTLDAAREFVANLEQELDLTDCHNLCTQPPTHPASYLCPCPSPLHPSIDLQELPKENPSAVGTLEEYLGTRDLSELKDSLKAVLDSVSVEGRTLPWDANARDEQILAQALRRRGKPGANYIWLVLMIMLMCIRLLRQMSCRSKSMLCWA